MSLTSRQKPSSAHAGGGINLVARARPYFGLIVLTTGLLTAFGIVSMLRMPSGIYPEVAFPRIVVIAQTPGLAVKDVEVAVTRPIEEAVEHRPRRVPRAVEVGSRRRRAIDRLRARHRHDPGAQRCSRPNGRSRSPAPRRNHHDHRAAKPFGLPDHLVCRHRRQQSSGVARLCLLRFAAADQPASDVSIVTVQGGDFREILIEVDPQRLVETGLSITDVADRITKDHQLKAVGRLDRGATQFQVLTDSQASDPDELAESSGGREERSADSAVRYWPRGCFA